MQNLTIKSIVNGRIRFTSIAFKKPLDEEFNGLKKRGAQIRQNLKCSSIIVTFDERDLSADSIIEFFKSKFQENPTRKKSSLPGAKARAMNSQIPALAGRQTDSNAQNPEQIYQSKSTKIKAPTTKSLSKPNSLVQKLATILSPSSTTDQAIIPMVKKSDFVTKIDKAAKKHTRNSVQKSTSKPASKPARFQRFLGAILGNKLLFIAIILIATALFRLKKFSNLFKFIKNVQKLRANMVELGNIEKMFIEHMFETLLHHWRNNHYHIIDDNDYYKSILHHEEQ